MTGEMAGVLESNTKNFAASGSQDVFSIEGFEKVGLRTVEREFKPGETIFRPGDPDDRIYFALSGVIRIYKTYGDDHREATTALVQAGGTIGSLNLLEGHLQDSFAEAVTEANIAFSRKAYVEQAMKSRPEFALKLFSSLFERLQQSDSVIEGLLHRDVSTRLAIVLLNLADGFGVKSDPGVTLDVRLTHNDLANMIASTREAVSKAMSEFQREGCIKTGNREIVLVDQAALAEHAYGPHFYRT